MSQEFEVAVCGCCCKTVDSSCGEGELAFGAVEVHFAEC